jgi:hypothetical protein
MADRVKDAYFPDYVMRVAPKLGAAAKQIQQVTQAPYDIPLASCLAAISAASQGVIDIQAPYGSRIPASIAIIIQAKSGERKSAVLDLVMGPLSEFDKRLAHDVEIKLREFRASHALWQSKRKLIESSIKKKQKNNESCDQDAWELEEHLKREPQKPVSFQLLYKDVSPKAMLEAMGQSGLAALISCEGGEILQGKIFDSIPSLNTAWTGKLLSILRVGKPAVNVPVPRLTTCLMIQPGLLDLQSRKKGQMLRDSGHWSRYLVFVPASTQGTRLSYDASISQEHIDAFNLRLEEILNSLYSKLNSGEIDRDVIKFSPMAAEAWNHNADQIEMQIGEGGFYERAPDHASKIAENIARVAGLIHFFEGHDGDISEETEELAAEICRWSSDGYMHLFVPPPRDITDAETLWQYLCELRAQGHQYKEKTSILQCCPGSLRKERRCHDALNVLLAQNRVRLWVDDRRKTWIVLDPGYHPELIARWAAPVMPSMPQFQAITYDPVPNAQEMPSDTV